MGIVFNAEEIYQIGVEVEKNGEAFYLQAAQACPDEDAKKLFSELAAWEKGHISLFEDLKSQLPSQLSDGETLDLDEQKQMYLKAAADSHIFIINKDVKSLVERAADPASILKLALGFEKDSVVLYTTMKSLVPKKLGLDTIDRLINEEVQHVAMLQQKLAAFAG
jgi:rubrerythrin